jgi:hypothetical protein
MRSVSTLAGLWLIFGTLQARADEVHLASGRVIEGEVTENGDRVVIALESGQITIARREVARIDHAIAPLVEAERRDAALAAGDRKGLLELADYCRTHGLGAKERVLLGRLLTLDPNHAEARARLGYVRTDKGWVTRGELAQRAAGARDQRARAALELEQKRADLALTEAKIAREKMPAAPSTPAPTAAPATPTYVPVYATPYYPMPPAWSHRQRPFTMPAPHVSGPVFPINGVRDPRSYGDEMQRSRR